MVGGPGADDHPEKRQRMFPQSANFQP
jgi:hypothetical protein